MTLAHGTDWLESARLVLRRIAPGDLPFFTRSVDPGWQAVGQGFSAIR
jgi:hypothetical protein